MIVRIATEGQYELADDSRQELEQLQTEALHACELGDESGYESSFARLLDFVRANGEPLGEDRLVGSEVILPPPDASLQEARAEFSGEGLIPE